MNVSPPVRIPQTSVTSNNPFARYNDLEPRWWWRESEPYSCYQPENPNSPWLRAGLIDLGGSDPLSLIRYFGNGSYVRYIKMTLLGCTPLENYPNEFNLDLPFDSTYYSLGDLEIHVDIARVPVDARWNNDDDGARIDFSMEETVALLNQHVAPYYRRISQGNLRIAFRQGREFRVGKDGSRVASEDQQFEELGICVDVTDCEDHGPPGGLNRILLNDVSTSTGGGAQSGWVSLGLVSFRDANMENIVHEIGHAWMGWPHSFAEVAWQPRNNSAMLVPPNPYSNLYDVMSSLLIGGEVLGWDSNMPSTLAINRYSAGWVSPENVALHLEDTATYTLSKPFEGGCQFLVIHSGRPYAFTTLEVLEDRASKYKVDYVVDPSVPEGWRPRKYEGVLVSRYDQTSGTGVHARFGPALYDKSNPHFRADVGWGEDDYSLIPDGQTRDIGGGVSVAVKRNPDGSYEVTVSGGKEAEFQKWCPPIPIQGKDRYDTGCLLNELLGD